MRAGGRAIRALPGIAGMTCRQPRHSRSFAMTRLRLGCQPAGERAYVDGPVLRKCGPHQPERLEAGHSGGRLAAEACAGTLLPSTSHRTELMRRAAPQASPDIPYRRTLAISQHASLRPPFRQHHLLPESRRRRSWIRYRDLTAARWLSGPGRGDFTRRGAVRIRSLSTSLVGERVRCAK